MRILGLALLLVLALAAPAAADPVVVTGDDAVHPRAGRDYTRLAALHLPKHVQIDYVTTTGKLVLDRDGKGPALVLLDPETKRRSAIPSPGSYPSVLDFTATTIWYVDRLRLGGDLAIYRYDRVKQRMRSFALPDAGRHQHDVDRLLGTYDGRLYFATGPRYDHNYDDLWSVRFGRPGTLRSEGKHKDDAGLVDGLLTWGRFAVDGPSHLVVRDLATGEVARWELPDGCSAGSPLQGNGRELVLNVRCDDPEGETLVLDRSGTVTAVLVVDTDEGALSTADRGAMFDSHFYDFTSGRLLDLAKPRSSFRSPTSGPGEHPVQVWPQHGRDLVVRLR